MRRPAPLLTLAATILSTGAFAQWNQPDIPRDWTRPPASHEVHEERSPQLSISVIDTAIVRRVGNPGFPVADTTRHLYSYDANAKLTSDITQKLVGDQWLNSLRLTNTYSEGKIQSGVLEGWSDSIWTNGSHRTYTYDSSGNLLSEMIHAWDGGSFLKYGEYFYAYNSSGKLLSDEYVFWNFDQALRYTAYHNSYTYDTLGHLLTKLEEVRMTNPKDPRLWVYAYDSTGNLISSLAQVQQDTHWVNREQILDAYDIHGKQTSELVQRWANNQWLDSALTTFAYDQFGSLSSLLIETWSDSVWNNLEQYTYDYDVEGNLTAVRHDAWIGAAWALSDIPLSSPFLSISDSAGNTCTYVRGYSYSFGRRGITVDAHAGISPLTRSAELSQNYPNPFNPRTTIKFELPMSSLVRLSVYDILGREVSVLVNERRNAGVYEVKFNATGLASGVYLYRITAGSFSKARELVLIK